MRAGDVLFARDAVAEQALLHLVKLGQGKLGEEVEASDDARRDRDDVQAAAQPCPPLRRKRRHGWEEPARLSQRPRRVPRTTAAMSSARVIDAYVRR